MSIPIIKAAIMATVDEAVTICPVNPTGVPNVIPISISKRLEMIKRAAVANPVMNRESLMDLFEGVNRLFSSI